jgi:cold shock CspA family protein
VVQSRILKDGSKFYFEMSSLAFDEAIVGEHRIFRMRGAEPTLICNEHFKTAIKQAGLTGLSFWEAFEPPFDKVGTVTALPPPIGKIKPEGRGREIFFHQQQLDAVGLPLTIGQTVRVQGRRNRYGYSATRLEII